MHTTEVAPRARPIRDPNRWTVRLTVAALMVLLAAMVIVSVRRDRPVPSGGHITDDELLAAMAAGKTRVVEQARSSLGHDPARLFSLAERALAEPNWIVRLGGCDLLAGQTDASAVALLVPRVSDSDGRVRMRAIGALNRVRPPPLTIPQKFAPIDDRDRWLLAWLDDYTAQPGCKLAGDLCELFAGAAHVEFGKPLADRCVRCHAGRTPAAFSADDACSGCHAAIHSQWSGSAHAQSLSHLLLATPNPSAGRSERMSFGEVRGIGCVECHPVVGQPARGTTNSSAPSQCPYPLVSGRSPEAICADCHASVYAQWLAWRAKPHPVRPEWPPGQVDLDVEGDERTCIDCHMKQSSEQQPRDHSWAARRDLEMLRQAVDVQALPPEDGHEVKLAITNLAGHAFPTGTRRRAIRLYAGPAGRGELPLVLPLSLDAYGRVGPGGAVLSPGEQRLLTIPLPPDVEAAAYRLVYVRDRYDPGGYTAVIVSGSCRLPDAGLEPLDMAGSKTTTTQRQE